MSPKAETAEKQLLAVVFTCRGNVSSGQSPVVLVATGFEAFYGPAGTRYIQAPLAYPSERRRRLPSLSFQAASDAQRPEQVR